MPDVRFVDLNLEDWLRARETPPRSTGHHVSDVVVRLLQAASRKFDHYGKGDVDETRRTMWHLGFTWEDVIAEVLAQQLKADPGAIVLPAREIRRGDLIGTPDRVIYGRGQLFVDAVSPWRLEETKVTWMSTREIQGDPRLILEKPKFAYWVLQLKTYASMLMDPDVRFQVFGRYVQTGRGLKVRCFLDAAGPAVYSNPQRCEPFEHPEPFTCILRALFVNNDYKRFQPAPMCWRIHWSLEELEAHWTMITEFLADEEKAAHERPTPDPAAPGSAGDAGTGAPVQSE